MKSLFPLRYLIPITHVSVFLFTALFVGFSTYTVTKDYYSNSGLGSTLPQISQKASAEGKQEYFVYEKHETTDFRTNGLNVEKITGYALTPSGDSHIIYSFVDDPYRRRSQKTPPTATLLSNGKVFLNGVSDFGAAVLDLDGSNLATDYRSIVKSRDFPVSNILFNPNNDKEFFFTYSGATSVEGDGLHAINWLRDKYTLDTILSSTFPSGDFWLKPVGWSSTPGVMYAERQSDALTYAQVWKVDTKTKNVNVIRSIKGAATTSVLVCPAQDYAVFVASTLDPSVGSYGEQKGPSELKVSNLNSDVSDVIYSSKDLLTDLSVSCAGKKIIVRENNYVHVFDLNGRELSHVQFDGDPLFFSDDGTVTMVRDDTNVFLLNLRSGEKHIIGEEIDDEANKQKISYNILGLTRD